MMMEELIKPEPATAMVIMMMAMMVMMEETKLIMPEPASYSSAMSWIAHGWQ